MDHTTEFSASLLLGDFKTDLKVDFLDFRVISSHWMEEDCGSCYGIDLNGDKQIGLEDLHVFSQKWLDGIVLED